MSNTLQYVHHVPGANRCLTGILSVEEFPFFERGMEVNLKVTQGVEDPVWFYGTIEKTQMYVDVYYDIDDEGLLTGEVDIENFLTIYLEED